MGKQGNHKHVELIADAQERAEHNINLLYRPGRFTSFTFAKWSLHKRFAIFIAPPCIAVAILMSTKLPEAFSQGYGYQQLIAVLAIGFVAIAETIAAVQWLVSRRKKQTHTPADHRP